MPVLVSTAKGGVKWRLVNKFITFFIQWAFYTTAAFRIAKLHDIRLWKLKNAKAHTNSWFLVPMFYRKLFWSKTPFKDDYWSIWCIAVWHSTDEILAIREVMVLGGEEVFTYTNIVIQSILGYLLHGKCRQNSMEE